MSKSGFIWSKPICGIEDGAVLPQQPKRSPKKDAGFFSKAKVSIPLELKALPAFQCVLCVCMGRLRREWKVLI